MTHDAELEDRLIRYCKVDTQSDETSVRQPSTTIQLDLSQMLVAELSAMGAADVRLSDYGVVLATIPATVHTPAPVVGWPARGPRALRVR